MAELATLRAEPRTVVGKKVKALRREGLIPGTVYGPAVKENINVSVNRRELERYYKALGLNTLFKLEWEGGSQAVVMREVQVDPVRWIPLHVDFFAPNLREKMTTAVEIILTEPSRDLIGMINQALTEVQIEGLPADMPMNITADISHLVEAGQHVTAGDIPLPPGITLITSADDVVVSVLPPNQATVEEVAEEAAAAESAEAAE